MQCNTNGGGWTLAGCASGSTLAGLSNSIDWGAPVTAGAWSAHTLEAGFGQATPGNVHDASGSGNWMAAGSNGQSIGLGVGPDIGAADQVLVRTDNALKFYDNANIGGTHWDFLASTTDPYYLNWSAFAGQANSGPLNSTNFASVTNTTDQYYTGPNFYNHGNPANINGSNATAVPWVGDHLVGFNQAQDQEMEINIASGVDAFGFSVVGRSDTQSNNQSTVSSEWLGGTNSNGIMEILVRAYDHVNPLATDLPIYTYEILVGGTTPAFGSCASLGNAPPTPCNDAPVVDITGVKGTYNIKSIVISSLTDSAGFFIDEMYYDQSGAVSTPEPAGFFLIGGGLVVLGRVAKPSMKRR
jgi:hypothetical protein